MSQPSSPSSVSETWLVPDDDDCEDIIDSKETDVLIGTTLLDTYKVDRVLGEGGMGRIYEAHHTRISEKRFAIKVLRPEFIASKKVRARFEREVEAIARINHPGVLTIVDVGTTTNGWPFMVSEHLHGLDLLAYMRRFGALHNDRVVHIGCRLAEALEATHARGVIHRDVKPSNIFLLGAFEPFGPEWDRVKLIDFGLSRLLSRDDQLTEAGMVMGTPAYMSPEQAQALGTDRRTDVYGVGSVLYAAATGVPPFREETPQQTLLAVMGRDPVSPRQLKPAISEGLEQIIQRAMAKRPEDRYSSMSALRLALAKLELRTGLVSSGTRTTLSGEEGRPSLVSRWLPKVRSLVFHALVLYGLATLAVRAGDELLDRLGLDGATAFIAHIDWPGGASDEGASSAATTSVGKVNTEVGALLAPVLLDASLPAADLAPQLEAPDAALHAAVPLAAVPVLPSAEAPPVSAIAAEAPVPAIAAPVPAVTDPARSLKERLLAQSSRATAMLDAVHTIEQLLGVSPESAGDADVQRILTKAAGYEGEPSRAALQVMSAAMGSTGPDLLYELMLNRPALSTRAKFKLSRFRVRKLFTRELGVAYDLRFAPTCSARLSLLKQANDFGDQRSINVLSALAGKFPRCGRQGRSPCLPLCEREAEQLTRSIDTIARRLRTGERTASVN
jgi:serine/threonine protein kinase